jgi:hypothetical protein
MFMEGRTNVKDDPALQRKYFLPLEKITSALPKPKLMKMQYILWSDIHGLSASYVFSTVKEKNIIKESVRPLDPIFSNL